MKHKPVLYIQKPVSIFAMKITQIGTSPGYLRVEDDSIVNFRGATSAKEGDYIIFEKGLPVRVVSAEEFLSLHSEVPENADPSYIESLIESSDFVETGDLTVCVITLNDGRKVSGEDNAITSTKEERRELAYHAAFNQLMRHEMFALQGLIAKSKGEEVE